MTRVYGIINKTIVTPALAATVFYLLAPVIFPSAGCIDNCLCCHNTKETAETVYSDCCAAPVITVSDKCCYKDYSHKTHFSMPDYKNYRNMPCDLRTYISDSHMLTELSGIAFEKQPSPVDIVYFVFKPPNV